MIYLLLTAIAFSTVMILLLSRGDPKRRRTARLPGAGHSRVTRRLLTGAVILPGLYLAVRGDSAAFLIWLGSCAIAGWLVTLSAARRHLK